MAVLVSKSITVNADIKDSHSIINLVDDNIEPLGASARTIAQIDIAIDELFSNIAKYAYKEAGGRAIIDFSIVDDPLKCVITFKDNGTPFNPLENDDPDLSPEARLNTLGGLGIFIVKKTMDEVRYAYENGFNCLTIEKKLKE